MDITTNGYKHILSDYNWHIFWYKEDLENASSFKKLIDSIYYWFHSIFKDIEPYY